MSFSLSWSLSGVRALLTPYGTKALIPASKNEPSTFNPHVFLLRLMPGEEERMK